MNKKIFGFIFVLILTVSLCFLKVYANHESDKTIKRIVSVVYDDSTSMNTNENWAYASYSLQNMIGLMNENDEFNVVKMSDLKNNNIDLSNDNDRSNDINKVSYWNTVGGTNTTAIEIAGNWLKSKKDEYKNSQTVEFWLVILTDGAFGNNAASTYTRIKKAMDGTKFEGVFVAIGNSVPYETKNDWNNSMGGHLINASNSNDIVNAMNEVSGLILGQGGKGVNIDIKSTSKGNGIIFKTAFPLKKFVIFEQNQSVSVKEVLVDELDVKCNSDFKTNKPGSGSLTGRIIHCETDNLEYIPSGDITVNFDSKIDLSSNKLKILAEAAVNVELKLVDKQGNLVDDIESAIITEGDTIELAAIVTSGIDGSTINLREWENSLSASLVVNGKEVVMKYNRKDNMFYATYKVEAGNNIAYSVVHLPGYFRSKSDVVNIYPKEVVDTPEVSVSSGEVLVPYKYVNDYEEIGTFTYLLTGEHVDGLCDFEFKNMPKGITVSVEDVFADKNGKLSVKIHNNVPATVKFYRNKDYKEVENSRISIDVKSGEYELQWVENSITEIILKPVKRNITVEVSKMKDLDNLSVTNFNKKDIYMISVLGDNEYLIKEELENISINLSKVTGITLESEVVEYNGKHALKIRVRKKLPAMFVKTGNINIEMLLRTIYDETSDKIDINFNIKDSFMKYLFVIIMLILIILLIGYIPGIKKKLYDKRYHLIVNDEDEIIKVKFITRILPYISESGIASDLIIKATSNKNKITVINNFTSDQKLYLDDEIIDNNISTFDIGLNIKFKVIESNIERIYVYSDSRTDGTDFSNNNDFSDMDSIFGYGEDNSFMNNNSNDLDFFG